MTRITHLAGLLFVALLLGCGSSDDGGIDAAASGDAQATTDGASGSDAAAQADADLGGDAAHACQGTCEGFWACTQTICPTGATDCTPGTKLCPAMDESSMSTVIQGCLDNPQCGFLSSFFGDGTDVDTCVTGVKNMKSLSSDFATACNGS